jgi:hypothetical protein
MTLVDALADPALFGQLSPFRDLSSWARWLAFLRALFALPMSEADRAAYAHHTGRRTLPASPPNEVYVCAGRRSGKTYLSAVIAAYLACFRDYRSYLAPGERAMILAIASDREQAGILLRYMRAFLAEIPMLAAMIERETADTIELTNRVTLAVATCSYRTVRGVTLAAAVLDEIAFWRVDGANPDREVLTALRPAMATIPGSVLLAISTPYARTGVLYEALRDFHGVDQPDVLTWRATSQEMNPTLPPAVIARARTHDAAAAAAEWDAEFREDLETFLPADLLVNCVEPGRRERPPTSDVEYLGAVDMSGGGPDASVLAIAHAEDRGSGAPRVVLDCVRGWRERNVEGVVAEMTQHLVRYRVRTVVGDRYAGEWVPAAFRRHGISYEAAPRTRSETYLELHPILATGRAMLLDEPTLLRELRQLERRTSRQGRDTIDHPPRLHDDHANATALALVAVETGASRPPFFLL